MFICEVDTNNCGGWVGTEGGRLNLQSPNPGGSLRTQIQTDEGPPAEGMPSADSQSSRKGSLSESEKVPEFRLSQTQTLEMTEDSGCIQKPASTMNHRVDKVLCSVLSHDAPAAACYFI